MTAKYDAVVIGAGLGGLSTATFLAQKGLKVLLAERHNIPGGYSTSFVRGRYEFEVALHELSGVGTGERKTPLLDYLKSLGVTDRVEFIHIPEMYRSVFPYLDITLPVGRDNFETTMAEAFPSEADGIHGFLDQVFACNNEVAQFAKKNAVGNPLTAPARFKNIARYLPATYGQILSRYVKDPYAKAVLSQYWGYFGLPPGKCSFVYFAIALATYMYLGAAFIKGRSQALSNAFIDVFESHGGQVKFNCGITRIHTDAGRVTGVTTEAGEEIEADYVISNADPITTCRELIGQSQVPPGFFGKLKSSNVAPSTVNVYLGIDKPAQDLGITNHEIFINKDYEFERHYESMSNLDRVDAIALTSYNHVMPDITPPGTCQIVLTALAYGEPWYNLPPEKYVETKTDIAEKMLQLAETVAPEIRKYAEVVEVSTPVTNMRYAGTMGGSIYGWDNTPFDHSVLRMSHKGPLSGLYFAGAWTQPGGGFEPSIMSGQMAGARVLGKFRKAGKGA